MTGRSKLLRRFLAFLFLFLALSVGTGQRSFSQNLPSPNANIAEEQDYAFAHGLYRDGLFQIAAEQFQRFAQKHPQSVRIQDALFLRADCLLQLGQFPDAAREFTNFINEYPNSVLSDNARFRLGDTYAKLKRDKDAVEAYKSILDHPKNPAVAGEAAYWIGEIYLKDDDYNNALKYYTLSYEGYPGNRLQDYAAYSAAWANQKKGDYAKAAEWYRIVVDKFPQSPLTPSSRVKVGECFYYTKDYTRAIDELTNAKPAIDSVALRGEADYLIGESYFNLGQFDKAQKQYESFLKEYPGHHLEKEVTYALGWSLFKQRQFDAAAAVFGKLDGSVDELGAAATFRKGIAEKLAGKRNDALMTFAALAARDAKGDYADNALYEAGSILFEDKKTDDARGYFLRIVTGYDTSDVKADAYMMLGECDVERGAFDSARVSFEKALSFSGISFETKVTCTYQSAWTLFKLRKFKEAASGFAKFVAAYPEHPKSAEALYWESEAEYQGGDFRTAIRHFQSIASVAAHPRREEAMYGIGWCHYKLGEFPKAIESFESLIVKYPSGKFSFDARLRLGDCYFQQKDYKKAAGAYRTVARLFPKNDGADYALYQLGQTFYRSADYDQASDQFSALIKTYPASSLADDAQFALGWMKFQRKDYLAAVKDFQTVLTHYPSSELVPRAYYSIGDSYYNLRQYAAAEKSYREVLQQFPKSALAADALTGIQYCLVAQGKSKEAVGTIDSYVKENPTSPNNEQLEIKKAELLFGQKQYADAAKEYRSFAEQHLRSPLRPQALYWLGRSLQESDSLRPAAVAYLASADAPNVSASIKGNALIESARLYLRMKQYDQAFKVLDRADNELVNTEFAPQAAYLRGQVFVENGAMEDAKTKFEFVTSKFPGTVEADKARIGLVRIALRDQQLAVAQDLSQKVATSRTDEIGAEAQYLSGLTYAQSGDFQNALTAYLRVKYVFPSHEVWLARAYVGMGQAYEQTKDVAKARESYQEALKLLKSGEDFDLATQRLKNLGQ
ncbi:MAG TPA: tetratricopeptide repeat protein [Bacteroidota bacterium]|nr:tetratricopeptide repeat protein [Bacteroidota bacterium]